MDYSVSFYQDGAFFILYGKQHIPDCYLSAKCKQAEYLFISSSDTDVQNKACLALSAFIPDAEGRNEV